MPKNIVLLSDGTGNSEASPFKTNVWRLYQVLDISPPSNNEPAQIACYNNGVGTETFRPLAMLGLALGIGVATNVKNLYTFLCRNYHDGDRIFLFGFSRGAFTVRLLAGLITRCGLVTAPNDAELEQRVKAAYAEYKRDITRRAVRAGRALFFGWFLRAPGTIEFNFERHHPDIAFIGVWDTVDAYGMPVDELKEAIDRWVWPMHLADRTLSDKVKQARHALSLDDERLTFRPVLWTDPEVDRGRLKQVWFPGVHANVGGGYPDDGIAYVSLKWMMAEAVNAGLRYYPDLETSYKDEVDIQGKQYDSRAGLAGYYRYGPRNVDGLCNDPSHGVTVKRPLIHTSAMERIRGRQISYAPVSFPEGDYALVDASGVAAETPDQRKQRVGAMPSALDGVFRRRVAYLATVAFTVVLAVLPLFDWIQDILMPPAEPASPCAPVGGASGWLAGWTQAMQELGCSLHWVAENQFAPAWTTAWIESFAIHPSVFLFCGVGALWLFVRKSAQIQDQIRARSEHAWQHVPGSSSQPPKGSWTDPIVRRLRTNRILVVVYQWLTRILVPFLLAVFVAAPVGLLILPFFLPKFVRNKLRRHRYGVRIERPRNPSTSRWWQRVTNGQARRRAS